MRDISLILLAAGSSSRFDAPVKKQWIRIEDKPLWQFVADRFSSFDLFDQIIITATKGEEHYMQLHGDYTIVTGGNTRQESLSNALKLVKSRYVIVSDIARACIKKETLLELIDQKEHYDVVVPYINVSDTVVYDDTTIDRARLKRIQTPQLSKVSKLKEALNTSKEFTDESSAIVAAGGSRGFVKGSLEATKITFKEDLQALSCLKPPKDLILSGSGFDVHEFDTTKDHLYLCGERVECGYGFKAHSDGDVAIHALIDALLGASGMGDIGELFPDTDDAYAGIDSKKLLGEVLDRIKKYGFELINIDLTIIAQKPKLSPYKGRFRNSLASICNLPPIRVNIKATTTEKLGFIGRGEGVGVMANANLTYYNYNRN
ncbi:2-C-methyl-D-erythritol 4-phosphate cytidylyltransferase / 2-C-methyl-D-erythritol 2,4-cyclodiphosphate synthase [hydrothermal vent metagenome]|uniref:2-C-methyl-D-erythritol 2,4-cyclodiphosphate synthase n=1 Tax=hydrothermal vent metagenome TaxID=652676 RepID=A0A1W1BSB9_9ZZZZ